MDEGIFRVLDFVREANEIPHSAETVAAAQGGTLADYLAARHEDRLKWERQRKRRGKCPTQGQ